jgi:hypothetical protein
MKLLMIIDLTPIITVFLNLLTYLIGLDFVWCGYWYMKTRETNRLPRLLGYLGLKVFVIGNRKNKSTNQFVNSMFSMEAAGKYCLISGIYLVVRGMFPLLTQLLK